MAIATAPRAPCPHPSPLPAPLSMSTSSGRLDASPDRGETDGEQNQGERLRAMGTPADFWIVLAAIAAWSAIVLLVALFADRTARDG
jgi:hypothetical protein